MASTSQATRPKVPGSERSSTCSASAIARRTHLWLARKSAGKASASPGVARAPSTGACSHAAARRSACSAATASQASRAAAARSANARARAMRSWPTRRSKRSRRPEKIMRRVALSRTDAPPSCHALCGATGTSPSVGPCTAATGGGRLRERPAEVALHDRSADVPSALRAGALLTSSAHAAPPLLRTKMQTSSPMARPRQSHNAYLATPVQLPPLTTAHSTPSSLWPPAKSTSQMRPRSRCSPIAPAIARASALAACSLEPRWLRATHEVWRRHKASATTKHARRRDLAQPPESCNPIDPLTHYNAA